MKKSNTEAHGGIALVEEAIQVLRRAPAVTLAAFYLGAIPFVLGLLHYWTDMSRGAYADRRLGGGALLLSALFILMKTCHAVFCTRLYCFVAGETKSPWTLTRLWQILVLQATLQPWGLLLKPIALLITLPYPWTRGFFEHLLICPPDASLRIRPSIQRASAEASLWPGPNTLSLALLFGFSLFLTINVAAIIAMGPSLYHTFLGEETTFTRSSYSIFNSTFLAVSVAGAYLCVNPIIKTLFILRKFYGASIHSGADLRLDLRRLKTTIAIFLAGYFSGIQPLPALEKAPSARVSQASQAQLSEKIDAVLQRPEYAWREPRVQDPTQKNGWSANLGKSFVQTIKNWFRPYKKSLKNLLEKWIDWLRNRRFQEDHEPPNFSAWSQSVPWLLGSGIVVLLGLIGWLIWKQPRRKILVASSSPAPAAPDLASENIAADQLPEEGWLTLGREMLAKGELRLALRAFYLATLTQLAARQWLTLARHKSNRDYEIELLRKGRSPQPGREAFSGTRDIFERVWYGTTEASADSIANVQANLEKIRQC